MISVQVSTSTTPHFNHFNSQFLSSFWWSNLVISTGPSRTTNTTHSTSTICNELTIAQWFALANPMRILSERVQSTKREARTLEKQKALFKASRSFFVLTSKMLNTLSSEPVGVPRFACWKEPWKKEPQKAPNTCKCPRGSRLQIPLTPHYLTKDFLKAILLGNNMATQMTNPRRCNRLARTFCYFLQHVFEGF